MQVKKIKEHRQQSKDDSKALSKMVKDAHHINKDGKQDAEKAIAKEVHAMEGENFRDKEGEEEIGRQTQAFARWGVFVTREASFPHRHGGQDHYRMGFHSETLNNKEFARLDQERFDNEKIMKKQHMAAQKQNLQDKLSIVSAIAIAVATINNEEEQTTFVNAFHLKS